MSFKAPESLAEQIAHHLGDLIITGKLKSKERIQELKVAGDLDVSRGSVREALLILESRHLIEILPRRGALVAELNRERVQALYETYIVLLRMLVVKMCENWKEGDLDPFREQLSRMSTVANAFGEDLDAEVSKQAIESGFELMRLGLKIAHNPYLETLLEDIQPAVHRCYFMALNLKPEELKRNLDFFLQVETAAMDRDTEKAEKAIQGYTHHLLQIMLSSLPSEAGA